jgi:hypothetical protein
VSDDVAVYWLDSQRDQAEDQAARALSDWARTRGVRLASIESHGAALTVDRSIAERAEKELDRAREAIGASDADTAERALAHAETLLREHPELPQAAWLRAEVERTWSARWLRVEPRDEARGRAAWENAQALDGGRVAGIGETSFPAAPRVKATILVSADGGPLTLRIDGVPITRGLLTRDPAGARYEVEVAPAEHHVTATVDDRVVFASWIAVGGGSGTVSSPPISLHVSVSRGAICSRDQLADVKREGDHVHASGVSCPQWIAALPGSQRGSVLVARCERDTCGPLLEWRVEHFGPSGPPQPPPKPGWPAWATWTLLGIGAATATSVAFVATGVFETRPVEPRFVVGGARQE